MVMVLVPTNRGTVADHAEVPEATPEFPVDVVHFTTVTPTLSVAVPLMAIEAAEVETMVKSGDRMVTVGGTVSGPVGAGVAGGVGGAGAGGGVGVTGATGAAGGTGGAVCEPGAPYSA